MYIDKLFSLQDISYRDFHKKLMPTVDESTVIGVRVPDLRRLAKAISPTDTFLKELPHRYYEENNLHAFIIENIRDFNTCVSAADEFLPYIDNWATCDMLSPKVFGQNTEKLLPYIYKWLASSHIYTQRFAIGMLMKYFLGEKLTPRYLNLVADIRSGEYYVNMMRAWYFATALSTNYDTVTEYLKENRLDAWTHNKTIQKAVESRRITKEQKDYLKKLRR